jgi:hypothetical protein
MKYNKDQEFDGGFFLSTAWDWEGANFMSCFFRHFGTLDTLACIYPLCLARRGGIIFLHNTLRRSPYLSITQCHAREL